MRRVSNNSLLLAVTLAVLFSGCVPSPRFTSGDRETRTPVPAEYRGRSPILTIEGIASYYAHDFHGRTTANGEVYDMHSLTAAHKSFPFNTIVRVHNLANNRSVVVRINDRGPFIEGRIIDLSLAAAREIDMVETGITTVRLEVLEWGQQ